MVQSALEAHSSTERERQLIELTHRVVHCVLPAEALGCEGSLGQWEGLDAGLCEDRYYIIIGGMKVPVQTEGTWVMSATNYNKQQPFWQDVVAIVQHYTQKTYSHDWLLA